MPGPAFSISGLLLCRPRHHPVHPPRATQAAQGPPTASPGIPQAFSLTRCAADTVGGVGIRSEASRASSSFILPSTSPSGSSGARLHALIRPTSIVKRWWGDQRMSSRVLDRLSKSIRRYSDSAPPACCLIASQVGGGKLNDLSGIGRDLHDHEVPQVLNNARQELAHVLPLLQQSIHLFEQSRGVP